MLMPNSVLKQYRLGGGGEGREGGGGVFEIQHLRIAVVFVIHTAKLGVGVEHGFFGFDAVVFNELAGYAEPDAVFERADFDLVVFGNLF